MNALEDSKLNQCSRTYDLYIGHVPKNIQEAVLLEACSKYGAVADVLIRHVSGPFGYGIVKFKQKKDAQKVLKVGKIIVDNHEMEVKNGKRSNQSVENCNGAAAAIGKSVSFAEPCSSIPHAGNIHLMESVVKDFKYTYPNSEGSPVPIAVEIMCTNVENAITFHGCPISSYEELQLISIKLNSICPNLIRLQRKPVLNKIYGALYNEDCQWYRCKVLQCAASANSSKCIVEYIDYGNVAEISFTNMVELPEPLKNICPFAIKCIFSNLIPSSKSQNCISYLHHLINHRMSLCALYSWGIPEYQVTKCSCNGIDVIAELVRNGYAIHRNQVFSKSLSPNVLDKASCKKLKDNQKTKKVNGYHSNKKNSDNSNGIDKHSYENRSEGVQVRNGRSSSPIESHSSQDFMPKKIIKRGSESVLNHQFAEEANTVNDFLKVDSVISNVKVINNIRGLIPLHTYDDLISQAVDLLRNEMNISISDDSKQRVENARKNYCKALADIKDCSEEEALSDFKEKRNKQRMELCNELKKFLETFDTTLLEKKKRIQETITALESNSTAWLNVYLPKIPDTIEELLTAFNDEKERKRNAIVMARRKTDDKRAAFLAIYTDLGKEFSLNVVDGKMEDSYFVNTGGKKGSWALKFDEALTEFGIALEEERKISTVIEDRSFVSVIQYMLEKLDIPKDKIDAECEVYEEYKSLYDDLTNKSDLTPVFNELQSLSEIINAFTLCSNDENAEKLSDEHIELHFALLHEDALLVDLVKASTQHFPELVREHPELHLEEYQKYSCLLKFSWDAHFFPHVEKCNRIEPSYVSKFCQEPVVIKEFHINPETEMVFLKKVRVWNEIKSNNLVKVKGLFKGEGKNIIYAVLPPVWETLYDKPLAVPVDYKAALNILQQVLEGLCDIHSRGIIHGAVHPMSILYKGDKVLLDLNFDKLHLQDKLSIKGINFQVPNEGGLFKSGDMYGFGCLVLWVLFPNLSFHATDKGVPDINAFQSIIQTMLCSKDFSALTALLNANNDIRPSSRHLRSNRFLKSLNIISDVSTST